MANTAKRVRRLTTESARRLIREEHRALAYGDIADAVVELDAANRKLRRLGEALDRKQDGKPFVVSSIMIDETIGALLDDLALANPDED